MDVEGEFRAAGTEFHDVIRQQLDLAGDALAIQQGPIAAVEVGEPKIKLLVLFDTDDGMPAADAVVALRVKGNSRSGIAPKSDFFQSVEIELLDLIGF